MKYTALFTATTLAVVSAQQVDDGRRNLATLGEKWNLTLPEFAYDSNTFNLTFPVTDFIETGMAKYSLWTAPDCKEGNVPLDNSAAWANKTLLENTMLLAGVQEDSGAFSGRSATVMATFDPQTISSQTDLYSEQEIDGQIIAEIRFCIRFELWTTGMVTTPLEVNFLETLVTLTVDLTDGFEIEGIDVASKDRLVRTANQAYEVRGYQCNADNDDPSDTPKEQGDIIHVCVTPEDEAQDDGIFMRSIDDFTFTRGPSVRQVAVENNAEATNMLTSYSPTECRGTLVCRFSTILSAQFYATEGEVEGAGVASMQFGSDTGAVTPTRRQLRAGTSADEGRALQDEGAGAAEFDLTFEVNQAADGTGSSSAESTSMSVAISLAGIAAVAAMF